MIGHVRHKVETFVRGQPVDPTIAAITMVMTHNSLARTHGFSPLQWAMGRDWSPGDRLLNSDMDSLTASTTSSYGANLQLRAEAAKAFIEHRARDVASRAKNSKTRSTNFPSERPGVLQTFSNTQLTCRPTTSRTAQGCARVGGMVFLACETKFSVDCVGICWRKT